MNEEKSSKIKKENKPNIIDTGYFLLHLCKENNLEMDVLKIQKLLYFIQGVHLAVIGNPLFHDKFQCFSKGTASVSYLTYL